MNLQDAKRAKESLIIQFSEEKQEQENTHQPVVDSKEVSYRVGGAWLPWEAFTKAVMSIVCVRQAAFIFSFPFCFLKDFHQKQMETQWIKPGPINEYKKNLGVEGRLHVAGWANN